MATVAATRPASVASQSSFYPNFSRPSSIIHTNSSLSVPTASSSRLRTSISSGNLSMGFSNMRDKVPARIRRPSYSRPRTPLPEEVASRGPVVVVEDTSPKRSSGFLSGGLRTLQKKRSVSNLFPSQTYSNASPVSPDYRSIATSTSAGSLTLSATLVPPKTKKRVSIVPEVEAEEMHERGTPPIFERKTHFVTKGGMKHHPYPEEAPYMQAYDPILLDKWVFQS